MSRPLDRIDFALLTALQNDGRLSNKELAASVGLAPSSCHERVRALRASGILRGFRGEVDPKAVGVGLQAMIAIRLRLHDRTLYEAFREHVLAMPEVVGIFYLSGRDDFLLHVAVRDVEHLREIAVDRLAARGEVGHMETAVIFEHHGPRPLPIYAAPSE